LTCSSSRITRAAGFAFGRPFREYEGRHLAADQAMIVIAIPFRDQGRLRVMRRFLVGPKGAGIDGLRRYMSSLVPPIPPSSLN